MRKKTLAIALAVIAIVSVVTTGTLAWLSAQTDPITNTFSPSTIGLKLEETTGETYKMVPGATIAKNPTVTVTAGSEACYVFVKIEENLGSWAADGKTFADYLTYTVANQNGWIALDGVAGVYYQMVDVSAADASDAVIPVLYGNAITVKDSVNKDDMKKLYEDNASYPKLVITAYAIQSANLTGANGAATPAEAWALASAQGN